MTAPTQREPKGDHNRRLSLGLDLDELALEAGVSPKELKDYEMTLPDQEIDFIKELKVTET